MEKINNNIVFNNSNDKEYQALLNKLLKNVFLDFQFWYDLDLWDDNYESYAVLKNNEIVSNICVFKTKIIFNQQQYQALSIGAVATKKEYRGNGYSRILMEHIIDKYQGIPMFLSANDSVVDFYPKFGFRPAYDKLPVFRCDLNNELEPQKLKYDEQTVWEYVFNHINFSKKFDCLNTASINIFHINLGHLKDCLYEIPELKTMVIAQQTGNILKLIGLFSLKEISFNQLIKFLPFKNIKKIEFAFTPYFSDLDYQMQEYKADPFFVRGIDCDLGDIKFPELSVT